MVRIRQERVIVDAGGLIQVNRGQGTAHTQNLTYPSDYVNTSKSTKKWGYFVEINIKNLRKLNNYANIGVT
jgi:hypothetical protein